MSQDVDTTEMTEEIEPEELNEILDTVNQNEIRPVLRYGTSYFVLGNYTKIRNLDLVKDRLNRRKDAYAFLMSDILLSLRNFTDKFELIAKISSYVVGVAEDSEGDFRLESGGIRFADWLKKKSYVLKREYEEKEPYSPMHKGVFEELDKLNRLYRWRDRDELVEATEKLPSKTKEESV